jgi:dihydropyrimidinase
LKQTLIKNGLIATGGKVLKGDILIEGEKVREVGTDLASPSAEILNANGLVILPGGVDVHVHLPWPAGRNISSDTVESGTRAAAFGGVTTVIDFCIPRDGESLDSVLRRKLAEAQSDAWVDYSFHLNIRENVRERIKEIPSLVNRGFPSFKVFMAYEGFRLEDDDLRKVLQAVNAAGGVVSVHAEDGTIADQCTSELLAQNRSSLCDYPSSRPVECEENAIRRLLQIQKEMGTRLHIHHVSSRAGVELIDAARKAGQPVTAETCPQYLLFTAEDYCGDPTLAASLVCAPSIKTRDNQQALWQGLVEGSLSVLATDHCPYTRAQKETDLTDFTKVPGGMGGVELRLPLIYSSGVAAGRISLERFAFVWAECPARAFGLYPRKGIIAPESDADLVILDPGETWTVHAADLHMNTDCLPYEGIQVTGRVKMTILRGNIIVRDDKLQANSNGKLIPRYFSD